MVVVLIKFIVNMDLKGANVTTTQMILHVVRAHMRLRSCDVNNSTSIWLTSFLFTQICDVNFDANVYM